MLPLFQEGLCRLLCSRPIRVDICNDLCCFSQKMQHFSRKYDIIIIFQTFSGIKNASDHFHPSLCRNLFEKLGEIMMSFMRFMINLILLEAKKTPLQFHRDPHQDLMHRSWATNVHGFQIRWEMLQQIPRLRHIKSWK